MALGQKAIEWRSVNSGSYHLFIGSKSICQRAYSNGKYDCTEAPEKLKKDEICGHCKKFIPELRNRLESVTFFIK